MIRINLLPQEFRVKRKTYQAGQYTLIAIISSGLILVITLLLFVNFLQLSVKHKKVEKEFEAIQPLFNELTALQRDVEGPLKQENDFMQQFVTTQRPLTQLLMWGSEWLPESAWIEEVRLTRDKEKVDFLIKGACLPGKEKTTIQLIEAYLQSFKEKMPEAKLMLKTTRMQIADVEVTEFTANFNWIETGVAG